MGGPSRGEDEGGGGDGHPSREVGAEEREVAGDRVDQVVGAVHGGRMKATKHSYERLFRNDEAWATASFRVEKVLQIFFPLTVILEYQRLT